MSEREKVKKKGILFIYSVSTGSSILVCLLPRAMVQAHSIVHTLSSNKRKNSTQNTGDDVFDVYCGVVVAIVVVRAQDKNEWELFGRSDGVGQGGM